MEGAPLGADAEKSLNLGRIFLAGGVNPGGMHERIPFLVTFVSKR